MNNIPDKIKTQAFQYASKGNIDALLQLIITYPDLMTARSDRTGNTLLISACDYVQKEMMEFLIANGSDLDAKDHNNDDYLSALHFALLKLGDKDVARTIATLHNFKPKYTCESTALITAVTNKALTYAQYIIDTSKQNKNEIVKNIVQAIISVPGPTSIEKNNIISIVEKYSDITNKKLAFELTEMVFQEKLREVSVGSDTTFHCPNLLKENPFGNFGYKIFNTIDVMFIKLLYKRWGIDLSPYEKFTNNLRSLKDELLKKGGMCSAVILESNKQEILRIVKTSGIVHNNASKLYFDNENLDDSMNLMLERICYLMNIGNANNDANKEEFKTILGFINEHKPVRYDLSDNFIKVITAECASNIRLQEVLKNNSEIIKLVEDYIPCVTTNLNGLEDEFKKDLSILANEVITILDNNSSLQKELCTKGTLVDTAYFLQTTVLPVDIFLNCISDEAKEQKQLTDYEKELIKSHLNFFHYENTYQFPKFDELNDDNIKDTIQYYKNNLKALLPISMLLEIAHDKNKLAELDNTLNSNYEKTSVHVKKCVNTMSKFREYYNSIKYLDLSTDITKQHFEEKILPELNNQIQCELTDIRLERLNNITALSHKVNKFLNISQMTSVFERYNNGYIQLNEDANSENQLLLELLDGNIDNHTSDFHHMC
ncbi:ankyrin repeat domain-containing protein [Orientia tsutsugamushi]|uniref:Ankyrin repeat-containing protein n=1 Tax=Orientia tsutsugamushi TaxID=784 RepID=A0A2U3QUG5_ORITS|nr:ankyrin repeat domain-containing protein [Orientia tsutsugamushi]KJV52625.1 ankyrin repeat family protein [Orientia tsutsugamushi str. Kato PP]SPR04634.1 ankyrin repeat-containing protein [Orientia tsutsugamushi]